MKGSKIFFSYSHVDKEFVLKLHSDLGRKGFNVWLDIINIRKGRNWDDEVELALRESECMLAILSPSSVASNNFKDEIGRALNTNKIIIPILLLECDVPLRLERKQYINFTNGYTSGADELIDFLNDPANKVEKNSIEREPALYDNKFEIEAINEKKLLSEEESWNFALHNQTHYSYQKYLDNFPNGKYKDKAKVALNAFLPTNVAPPSNVPKSKLYLIGAGFLIILLVLYFASSKRNAAGYDSRATMVDSGNKVTVSGRSENKGQGATIKGKILYGGYGAPPIGVITNYSKAPAVLENFTTAFTYNNQTGEYTATGVPSGKFSPFIRIEAGYPFNKMSAGDYISNLSGLNNDIVVGPNDKQVNADLKVVLSIHLKRPVDNQVERTNTTDPPEVLYSQPYAPSAEVFEWEPVPEAVRYQVRFLLMDGTAKVNEFPFTIAQPSISPNLAVNSGNTRYMFSVDAYTINNSLIGNFTNYFKNGYGGWFEFKILAKP